MTEHAQYRLDGLEPDNLLAFLALLGLLRALETTRPDWLPRAAWDVENPPLRPILTIAEPASREAICQSAAVGVATLAAAIDFGSIADLKMTATEARELLERTASGASDDAGRYFADLCAALISDAAQNQENLEPTPLALSGGKSKFLPKFVALTKAELPEKRSGDPAYPRDAGASIAQALFSHWTRLDRPPGLRWDPEEAKRHAYQWNAPTDEQPKTQHGANRLAIIGLSALTAVPVSAGSEVRLSVTEGEYDRDGFTLAWPIWRTPASFAGIRALLSHPDLRKPQALDRYEVDHIRVTRRISLDRYRNFTYAEPL